MGWLEDILANYDPTTSAPSAPASSGSDLGYLLSGYGDVGAPPSTAFSVADLLTGNANSYDPTIYAMLKPSNHAMDNYLPLYEGSPAQTAPQMSANPFTAEGVRLPVTQESGSSSWYDPIVSGAKSVGDFVNSGAGKALIPTGAGILGGISTYQQNKKAAARDAALQARLDAQYAAAMRRRQLTGVDTSLKDTVAQLGPYRTRRDIAVAPSTYGREGAGVTEANAGRHFENNVVPKFVADGGSIHSYYAAGGTPEGEGACPHCGGLAQASRYVKGGTAGQSDKVPAMLSDGEYVMDADTVANLGDGNNAAGAVKLDQMRQSIRRHKRSTAPASIPPKAKDPMAYIKGGK